MTMRKSLFSLGKRATVGWWGRGLRRRLSVAPGSKKAHNRRRTGDLISDCCCSVTQSCLTLCDPMDCSRPGFPAFHHLPELAQLMSIESVMSSNHLILCCPLLLPPSIFPSIRVFSNKSALLIRWPGRGEKQEVWTALQKP